MLKRIENYMPNKAHKAQIMGTLKEKFCQNPKRFFASLLKMLESDTGDCTLVTAEGLDIRCHRLVLLQSPVLRSLISRCVTNYSN